MKTMKKFAFAPSMEGVLPLEGRTLLSIAPVAIFSRPLENIGSKDNVSIIVSGSLAADGPISGNSVTIIASGNLTIDIGTIGGQFPLGGTDSDAVAGISATGSVSLSGVLIGTGIIGNVGNTLPGGAASSAVTA